jgi:hypothetical protein
LGKVQGILAAPVVIRAKPQVVRKPKIPGGPLCYRGLLYIGDTMKDLISIQITAGEASRVIVVPFWAMYTFIVIEVMMWVLLLVLAFQWLK